MDPRGEPWNSTSWSMIAELEEAIRQRSPAIHAAISLLSRPDIAKAADECTNLFEFAEVLRRKGLLVDNRPFKWKGHSYLIDPYRSIEIVGQESEHGAEFVWMCGAQVGKTIAGFILLIWLALKFWGQYVGYFLPDKSMADSFSQVRFKPMAERLPEIAPFWGKDPTTDGEEADKVRIRSIGPSKLFFSYMGGKTSTESIPMLAVIFDEVRRMMEGDIERALERCSHSPFPIRFFYSTAGYPDANIDRRFRMSTQNKFHSRCNCREGVVLSDHFPACIGSRDGLTGPQFKGYPDYFYVCPTCKEPVHNPRRGEWLEHNPGAFGIGFHIAQTLSSLQTASTIYKAFSEAMDIQEFYNSKLGIPYLAPESRIVDNDILRATVNPDLRWPVKTGIYPQRCAMGVDQMGLFNVVTIRTWGAKDALGQAKSQLVHLEWIEADDPWERCGELMKLFDVRYCVVDALPNYNEAFRFAKKFRGRVWLADYSYTPDGIKEICEWLDKPRDTEKQKRASTETKNKYRVRIARYQGIEWNLLSYVEGRKTQPHERGLIAEVKDNRGIAQPVFICADLFWTHLQKVARRKITVDELQGKFKMVFENIGLDPHFLHADLYSELALSRLSPDDNKAFSVYRPDEPVAPEPGRITSIHDWEELTSTGQYKCRNCKVSVQVRGGMSPDDTALQVGFDKCEVD